MKTEYCIHQRYWPPQSGWYEVEESTFVTANSAGIRAANF